MNARALSIGVALLALNALLVLPDRLLGVTPGAFLRVGAETLLILALLALTPVRWQKAMRGLGVAVLMAAIALKIGNTGTYLAFDRPIDLALDLPLIPKGFDLLTRSHGIAYALGAVLGGIAAVAAVAAAGAWALRRVTFAWKTPVAVGVMAAALIGLGVALPGVSRTTAQVFADEARIVTEGFRTTRIFAGELSQDPLAAVAPPQLLHALQGHDVLVVFVESYGRVAVDAPRYGSIAAQLDRMTERLRAAGFASRSAWLGSPTFGGESWLAHSTTMSGLWVNDQRRYNMLVGSKRTTLLSDFSRAGWRTAVVMPEITMEWTEGSFFRPDVMYDAPALDFRGEPFTYITMADQFTLSKFQRMELAKADRKPMMAEIALVSSHAPWTPLPKLVPWDQIGDGQIFDTAREGPTPEQLWEEPEDVRAQYGRSISYVLETLESFVLTHATDKTVLIVLGDHQPMSFVSGEDATRDVPVHVIAKDPAVTAAIADWHWTDGMRPTAQSPQWKMDALRTRIVTSFSGPAP